MTTKRLTEPSSSDPTDGDIIEARALETPRLEQSEPAIMKPIALDDLDKELEKRGLRFVRYADDFLVLTKSEEAAKRVFKSIDNNT